MKILQVCEYYQELGGTERYLLEVSAALEEAGHDVSVAYGTRTADTISFPGRGARHLPAVSGAGIDGLEEMLKAEAPDVAYLHNVSNGRLVEELAARVPCVRYVHDHRLFCPKGDKVLASEGSICDRPCGTACFFNAYANRCLPRAPWKTVPLIRAKLVEMAANRRVPLLVASGYMRNCLAANGFASESIEVLPYYCRSAAGAEPEGKYVLFAGRVIRQKGIPELLAAAAHFPEGVGLLVAGEGEYSGEARALAERSGLGGRVRFLGRLSPEELGARYAGCLVVAVPSTWGEPFGIIGIEAMANGKPVVAFDVGGIGEWLKDGRNGFLVPRGDAMALAGKISLLCGDRQLRLRFGQEGRRMHEERFTKETHLKRLTDILSGVARKERR